MVSRAAQILARSDISEDGHSKAAMTRSAQRVLLVSLLLLAPTGLRAQGLPERQAGSDNGVRGV